MPVDDIVRELLPLYVLGLCDAAEARMVEEALAGSVDVAREVALVRDAAALISYAAPAAPLPAEIRSRVLGAAALRPRKAQVYTLPVSAPRRFRAVPLLAGLAAAAAIAAVVLSETRLRSEISSLRAELDQARVEVEGTKAELARTESELTRGRSDFALARADLVRERGIAEFLGRESVIILDLEGTNDAPFASGTIAVDRASGRAFIRVANLPPPPPGTAYQLWSIPRTMPLPGRVFATAMTGTAIVEDHLLEQSWKSGIFAVSLEPVSGVTAPTGAILLIARETF